MTNVMTKNYEIYDKKSTQKKFQAMVTYINYDYKCKKRNKMHCSKLYEWYLWYKYLIPQQQAAVQLNVPNTVPLTLMGHSWHSVYNS